MLSYNYQIIIALFSILFFCGNINAQNYTATYAESQIIDLKSNSAAQIQLAAVVDVIELQKSLAVEKNYYLVSDGEATLYRAYQKSSSDGNTTVRFNEVRKLEWLLLNSNNQTVAGKYTLLKKPFSIRDKFPEICWEISPLPDTLINNYYCKRATGILNGEVIDAFYTEEVPFRVFPRVFHGLPGAVIMATHALRKYELKDIKPGIDPSYVGDVKGFSTAAKNSLSGRSYTISEFEEIYQKKKAARRPTGK